MKKIAYLLIILFLVISLTACDGLVERGFKEQLKEIQAGVAMLADCNMHAVLDAKTIHLAARVAAEVEQPSLSKIFTDITDYHLTPVQAAGIAHQLNDSRAKVLVTMDALYENVYFKAGNETPGVKHVVFTGIAGSSWHPTKSPKSMNFSMKFR